MQSKVAKVRYCDIHIEDAKHCQVFPFPCAYLNFEYPGFCECMGFSDKFLENGKMKLDSKKPLRRQECIDAERIAKLLEGE